MTIQAYCLGPEGWIFANQVIRCNGTVNKGQGAEERLVLLFVCDLTSFKFDPLIPRKCGE